jgi:hypothetical protein
MDGLPGPSLGGWGKSSGRGCRAPFRADPRRAGEGEPVVVRDRQTPSEGREEEVFVRTSIWSGTPEQLGAWANAVQEKVKRLSAAARMNVRALPLLDGSGNKRPCSTSQGIRPQSTVSKRADRPPESTLRELAKRPVRHVSVPVRSSGCRGRALTLRCRRPGTRRATSPGDALRRAAHGSARQGSHRVAAGPPRRPSCAPTTDPPSLLLTLRCRHR